LFKPVRRRRVPVCQFSAPTWWWACRSGMSCGLKRESTHTLQALESHRWLYKDLEAELDIWGADREALSLADFAKRCRIGGVSTDTSAQLHSAVTDQMDLTVEAAGSAGKSAPPETSGRESVEPHQQALRDYLARGNFIDRSGVADSASMTDPIAPHEPSESSYRSLLSHMQRRDREEASMMGVCCYSRMGAQESKPWLSGGDNHSTSTEDITARPLNLPGMDTTDKPSSAPTQGTAEVWLPSMLSGTGIPFGFAHNS